MSEIGPLQRARELEQLNRSLRDANDELAATNARLERETAAKDQFLAALSHELRNPLAAIQGAVDLLQDTGDGHADEQQLMLDVVDRQVQALKQTTTSGSMATRSGCHRRSVTCSPTRSSSPAPRE
ncbi:MAG: histidine kinase dimerization/phospho-acceptor domain-containing protein [Solirubrobacteraceae bacterium]